MNVSLNVADAPIDPPSAVSGSRWTWPSFLAVVTVTMAWTYRFVPSGHFQNEMDVIRASAARSLAAWFPHFTSISATVAGPALMTSGTFLPGVWIYHAGVMLLFGPSPAGHTVAALILHWACALSVAALAAGIFGDRRAAWAGLVFALYPALGDIHGALVNGPALMGLFWALQAAIRYRAFVRDGRPRTLAATAMMIFLAVSCDRLGLFSLVLVAMVEWTARPRATKLPAPARAAFVIVMTVPVALFLIAMARTQLPIFPPAETAADLDWQQVVKALLFSFKGAVLPGVTGGMAGLVAVLLGSGVFLAGVYRSLGDVRLLAPVAAFAAGTALVLSQLTDPSAPLPTSATAHLPAAVCASIIAGDWFRAVRTRASLAAALIGITVFWSILDAQRSLIPVERGRRVAAVADELDRIYTTLGDEADIYLLDDGIDREVLLTAHLDFVYRHGLTRPTRLSFVMAGMLFPGDIDSPVGRLGAVTRIEVTPPMVFVGWAERHEGLVDMTAVIRTQFTVADKVMDKSGYLVEPFPVGGVESAENWVPKLSPEMLTPGKRHAWFLEAPIIRLHSTIGRFAADQV